MRERGDFDLNLRSEPQLREYRAIHARIVRDRPDRVLDWGCGHGHAAHALQSAGLDVVALEYRPDAEEGGRERLGHFPDVEALLTREPVRLPFEDASFDAVLSLGVLEHVPDPEGSLAEINRVLRPAGTFYLYKLPNRWSYLEKIAKVAGLSYHGSRPHDTLWTPRSTREALERHGFEVRELRHANMLPLTVPGRTGERLAPLLWPLGRALARVPLLGTLATNVEAVATKGGDGAAPAEAKQIAANVRGYRRAARNYERLHPEIFNPREQARLRETLERALAAVADGGTPRVLDFGCGSGNLTQHLVELGASVVAADVSPSFLSLVGDRFAGRPVETLRLNGRDLSNLPDGSVDAAVAYSVLHHVPDYLRAVAELCRVVRPGGVVLIDHESAPREYDGDAELAAFRAELLERELARPKRLRRFADPWHWRTLARHYAIHVRRRLGNPRYWPEGDIHIWPDDHIEWPRVERVLEESGCEILAREDYLLYRDGVPSDLYERYRGRTADVRLLLARRAA